MIHIHIALVSKYQYLVWGSLRQESEDGEDGSVLIDGAEATPWCHPPDPPEA